MDRRLVAKPSHRAGGRRYLSTPPASLPSPAAANQAHDEQKQYGTYGGVDDCTDQAGPEVDPELGGSNQLPIKAPSNPTTRSPMSPNPVPWTSWPASQPATRPTNKTTNKLSLDMFISLPLV
jgi:hypothetical protein